MLNKKAGMLCGNTEAACYPSNVETSVTKTLRAPVGISVPIVGLVMGKNNATQRPSNCMVNHNVEYICQ